MSLKDRFNSQNKTSIQVEKKKQDPAYYQTSDISQAIDSLGEIDSLFADDEINSIYVMGAKNIFVERKGKKSKISLTYRDNVRLENIIRKKAQFHGIKFDEQHPNIEFCHKLGINVWATLPPLSNVASMIIKCYKEKFATLKGLCESQALSKEMVLLIGALASMKLNVVIAGEKNTLKTTLLSAIAKEVPQNNNAVVFDYSNELKIDAENVVTYDFKNYENENLFNIILSSNPDRIFLNDYANYKNIEKYNKNGYKGFCYTIDAKNPNDVLEKINSDYIDVLIYTEQKETKRYVSSISIVENGELKNIFYLNEFLEHCSSGVVPGFYKDIEQSAYSISNTIFDSQYRHTYYQSSQDNESNSLKRNLNIDILKKFKKDLDIKKENHEFEELNLEDEIQYQEAAESSNQQENNE